MVEIHYKIDQEPQHSLKSLELEIKQFLTSSYQGRTFEIKSQSKIEGKPFCVLVTRNTIDEITYKGGRSRFACLYQIKEIVENGLFDRLEDPKRDLKNQKYTW